MFNRTLGGIAAALTIAGTVSAQSPSIGFGSRPAFAPNPRAPRTAEVQQAAMKSDAVPMPPVVLPSASAPLIHSPAPAQAPVAYPSDMPCQADIDAACADSCGSACDALCGPPGRMWIGAEWLYWGAKGNRLPPLVTSAPAGTARGVAGTVGGPGTNTLIDNQTVNDEWRSGFRLYGGLWLNDRQTLGLDGGFFFLGRSGFNGSAGSDGTDILTRPFVNNVRRNADGTITSVPPFQDTQLVSFPGVLSGTTTVNSTNEFYGFNVGLLRNLTCSPCGRLDALIGYRNLQLRDELTIRENLTGISPNAGTNFLVTDRFRTTNSFNGGYLGLAYERRFSHFYANVRGTVALGNTRSEVDIDGSTVITPPGGSPTTFAGGLLAQPSNIGRYTRDAFSVVPEVTLRLGVQVTQHLRVYGGYNFLYWSNVVRPEDVIDLRVNASQIPPRTNQTGTLYPQYNSGSSDFWAHGVMVGAEFRY